MLGLLRDQGHVVTHAAHGLAALSEVATRRFDAALLDLDLPGLDGLALARMLRTQGFAAPLLAVTARSDADAETQVRAAGFDDLSLIHILHDIVGLRRPPSCSGSGRAWCRWRVLR